ncbi:MAG: hypothetical protein JHC93_05475, partial [Parachlamydiales bacterium]|nr:hypothetical protein [Parachlamydiales bacterium]
KAACIAYLIDKLKNNGFNQNLAVKNNLLYSANGDNVIEVIDMNTSQVKAQLRGHVDTILTYVVFKNMLVSTSADGALKFWNTNNNTLIESKKLGKEFTELTIEDGKLFGSFVTYTKGPQNTNSATAHKESLETPT